jgi:hypothetical protein
MRYLRVESFAQVFVVFCSPAFISACSSLTVFIVAAFCDFITNEIVRSGQGLASRKIAS